MKPWFDWVMSRRTRSLTVRLRPWIPEGCRIADVGSGSGHNAHDWRRELRATVDEFDVADLHWVGPGPSRFDGRCVPAADAAYDLVTLLFVLQYSPDVLELLTEARRLTRGRVLVVQSTCSGWWGRLWLGLREFCWGPLAFSIARLAGVIRGQPCPLISRTMFSRDELKSVFQQAGLTLVHWEPQPWPGLRISRDLFVLEPSADRSTCRSSSLPAMRSAGCQGR